MRQIGVRDEARAVGGVGPCGKELCCATFLRDFEPAVNTIVYDTVTRFSGSISAEHGVGTLKPDKLIKHKSPVPLEPLHTIKNALDPPTLPNPGRVLKC